LGSGFSTGLGFKLSANAWIDYGFLPQGDLGGSHRLSLSLRFGGGKAEALFQEGIRKMRQGDFAGAVLLFDKVLALDPNHPSAARLLKEAAGRMKNTLP
jgi:hypothetical protein